LVGTFIYSNSETILLKERNFFGTVKVVQEDDPNCHAMFHGSTIHGGQCNISKGDCTPIHYYHNSGPMGQILEIAKSSSPQLDVGIIGLGVGSLTCYAREPDVYTYYEIDPLVEEVARNQSLFTFLSNSKVKDVEVILGDARISLENDTTSKSFDILIVDAFSSDVVPSHLLTIEAIKLYQRKLRENGFLVIHISNRFFNLSPVLGTIADKLNLDAILLSDLNVTKHDDEIKKFPSEWIVLIDKNHRLEPELKKLGYSSLLNGKYNTLWTDNYSSLIPLLKKIY